MTTRQELGAHVALVTGGSRGIGAAIAVALAASGAAVAVNYRERADDAEAVVAGIKAKGGRARGYAARLVKDGITVNAVAPSLIETDMMRGRTDLARNIPLGRMGQADEVAQAVMMVLGNSYMTGQTIVLNGGMAFI